MWLVSKKLHLSNLVALMFFAKDMYWFLHLSFTGTAGALMEGFTKKKVAVLLDFVHITSTPPHCATFIEHQKRQYKRHYK